MKTILILLLLSTSLNAQKNFTTSPIKWDTVLYIFHRMIPSQIEYSYVLDFEYAVIAHVKLENKDTFEVRYDKKHKSIYITQFNNRGKDKKSIKFKFVSKKDLYMKIIIYIKSYIEFQYFQKYGF